MSLPRRPAVAVVDAQVLPRSVRERALHSQPADELQAPEERQRTRHARRKNRPVGIRPDGSERRAPASSAVPARPIPRPRPARCPSRQPRHHPCSPPPSSAGKEIAHTVTDAGNCPGASQTSGRELYSVVSWIPGFVSERRLSTTEEISRRSSFRSSSFRTMRCPTA